MKKDNERNTIEFKTFKLFSNSTLKSFTKIQLIDYIHTLYHNWQATDETYYNVMEYAKGITNNPPLTFDDLKEGMWVWDDAAKVYAQVDQDFDVGNGIVTLRYYKNGYSADCIDTIYEENRFYRRQRES